MKSLTISSRCVCLFWSNLNHQMWRNKPLSSSRWSNDRLRLLLVPVLSISFMINNSELHKVHTPVITQRGTAIQLLCIVQHKMEMCNFPPCTWMKGWGQVFLPVLEDLLFRARVGLRCLSGLTVLSPLSLDRS